MEEDLVSPQNCPTRTFKATMFTWELQSQVNPLHVFGETNLCCRLVLTFSARKCVVTMFRFHMTQSRSLAIEFVTTNLAVVVDDFPLCSHPRGFLHFLVHGMFLLPVRPNLVAVRGFKRTKAADKVCHGCVSGLYVHF